MTQNMAIELSPHNIRVNAVSPGIVYTPAVAPFLDNDAVREAYLGHLLIQRIGTSEDIANAALFLASEEASYITGVNLMVDGGWTASGGVGRPSQAVAATFDAALSELLGGTYSSVAR
jgi:meso-butanediol dehydrogenase / (S,S)-butanediol dehydrogenase / diacetyl reductase